MAAYIEAIRQRGPSVEREGNATQIRLFVMLVMLRKLSKHAVVAGVVNNVIHNAAHCALCR